jgi:serine kinase of HPr protein (carbohydrate metabolism regulator)
MTVKDLSEKLNLKVLNLADGDREIKGGYAGDLLSWVMGRAKEDCAWVTIMTNINVIAVASLADVACVILSENAVPDEQMLSVSGQKEINLLQSEKDTFTLCGEIATLLK